jgi:hypothetical protein
MNANAKFDIQLATAKVHERRLHKIFTAAKLEKIELKSESTLWERTGNICIEYRQNGQPSGIAVTQADYWVHELLREGETLCYLMFPIERLKTLARTHIFMGHIHKNGGDRGNIDMVLIPLADILK